MLFDLKGKRRRAVQGTYLTLAVLMGAGLVLFGVGSSTSGGLGNLFGSNGSGSSKTATRAPEARSTPPTSSSRPIPTTQPR